MYFVKLLQVKRTLITDDKLSMMQRKSVAELLLLKLKHFIMEEYEPTFVVWGKNQHVHFPKIDGTNQ